MAEEEDDDYMNDELIKQCEAAATSSKTGAKDSSKLASAATRRKIAIEKRHREEIAEQKRNTPRARLEKGLSTTIPEDNVGFRLLSKMGFKPGTGLGKNQSGRSDPVPLEFRQGRAGLGREAVRSRIEAEREAARQRIVERHRSGCSEKEFVEMQRRRTNEYRTRRDLFSARKSCMDLDVKLEISKPFKKFYWPESAVAKKDEDQILSEEVELSSDDDSSHKESSEVEMPSEEQLEELSAYLRLQHSYCLWCGCVFDDADDLAANCPGPSAEFHD